MLILASSSPRRKEILQKNNYEFTIIVKEIDETMDENFSPFENVLRLGLKKAMVVAEDYINDIVIGCDTIVVYENKIYGKPKDEKDAFNVLRTLSGNTHEVISGVGIIYQNKVFNFGVISKVTFKNLTDEEINNYIASKEPFGKAGSYAIQGLGGQLVESYEGELDNIIGLPFKKVKEVLDELLGNK